MTPIPRWALAVALSAAAWALPAGGQEEPATAGEADPVAAEPAPAPTAAAAEAAQDTEPTPADVAAVPARAALPPGRIEFEFTAPGERGGGTIRGSAGAIETDGENEVALSGGVDIQYRRMKFHADRVQLHRDTLTFEAEGDIIFDEGARRISASRADYDMATETGSFWNATAYVEPDQHFWGAIVIRTGENRFEVKNGVLTSCAGDTTPDWSLRVASADIEIGGYARVKHGTMRLKKMPLFYWPYIIWPAKNERSSGLLIPTIGYSETRGAALGLSYYQVLGPSADLTIQLDGFEQTYAGAGAEFRYAPTAGTRGEFNYYLLADLDQDRTEWRASLYQRTQDLPFGMTGVIEINEYSDFEYFRQFERTEQRNTRRYLYSNAFVSGGWGPHSLSIVADQRETFLDPSRSSIQRQMPEVNYRLRKLKLGRLPLYVSLDSTASYFHSETTDLFSVDYGRLDALPQLTLPLRVAPWLSIALTAATRATWWGESVPVSVFDEETGLSARMCGDRLAEDDEYYCGDSLSRTFSAADFEMVGPTFSKIFDSPGGRFSKFKHVIEPRWAYSYVGQFDDQDRVPRFDEIDRFGTSEVASVALVNRILAKPSEAKADDAQDGEAKSRRARSAGAFEIFSFELSQAFSMRDDQPLQRSSDGLLTSKESAIFARLRYNPVKSFDLQGRATWSTLFSGLESTSLSMRFKGERTGTDLTWYTRYSAEDSERRSDQARVGVQLAVVPKRFWLGTQVNYDILNSEVLQQSYWASYESQCWSFLLEGREQKTSTYAAREYRFMLSLKNIGTFLDINGGNATSRF